MRALNVALAAALWASACSTSAPRETTPVLEKHTVVECRIYGPDKRLLRTFPGEMCAFFPDGSVAIASSTGVPFSLRDASGKILWERQELLHHQLNLDVSKTHLLTLGSELGIYSGKAYRDDVVLVYDRNGQVVRRFSFIEHFYELDAINPVYRRMAASLSAPACSPGHQLSHANSIYEIPRNAYSDRVPAFAAGNYIVNSLGLGGIFILDREMKHILWGLPLSELATDQTHDVQVLPDGNLLFFRNEGGEELPSGRSSLVEYDPILRREVWSWDGDPQESFFSPVMGGVQALPNGNLVFSNALLGYVREVTRRGVPVWDLSPIDPDSNRPFPFQQAKREDLTHFLDANHDVRSIPPSDPGLGFHAGAPDLLYGFLFGTQEQALPQETSEASAVRRKQRLPPPRADSIELRVDGKSMPVVLVNSRFFAAEVANVSQIRVAELFVKGVLRARMMTWPVRAFPGFYVANFVQTGPTGWPAPDGVRRIHDFLVPRKPAL